MTGHGHPVVVVAGLGSEYRRDDGAGPLVAGARRRRRPGVGATSARWPIRSTCSGCWDDADLAVVVDAVRSGAAPGHGARRSS